MLQKCHYFAATGRELDPGILDTRFPLVRKSGLSKEQQQIQKNLEESKEKTREIQNRQKYRVHLNLKTGDNILVRLGNKKIPEPDTYVVVRVEGSAITARNETSGRVLTLIRVGFLVDLKGGRGWNQDKAVFWLLQPYFSSKSTRNSLK